MAALASRACTAAASSPYLARGIAKKDDVQMALKMSRGTMTAELGISLGLMLVVVAVLSDSSAAWRLKSVLQTAASEGARIASTTPALQKNDADVLRVMDDVLKRVGVDVATCVTCSRTVDFQDPLRPGDPVQVRVVYDYFPVFGKLVQAFKNPIRLTTTSTMRYEPRMNIRVSNQLPPS